MSLSTYVIAEKGLKKNQCLQYSFRRQLFKQHGETQTHTKLRLPKHESSMQELLLPFKIGEIYPIHSS